MLYLSLLRIVLARTSAEFLLGLARSSELTRWSSRSIVLLLPLSPGCSECVVAMSHKPPTCVCGRGAAGAIVVVWGTAGAAAGQSFAQHAGLF